MDKLRTPQQILLPNSFENPEGGIDVTLGDAADACKEYHEQFTQKTCQWESGLWHNGYEPACLTGKLVNIVPAHDKRYKFCPYCGLKIEWI